MLIKGDIEFQQETSKHHQIEFETNGGENLCEDELRPPEPEWIISINKILDQAEQDNKACSWANRSIYRIPHYLKDGKKKAYIPQIVCLGPYHHGDRHLRKMDQHKWRCLKCILKRNNQKIEDYLCTVRAVEKRARACYEETIDMSSNKFVEMMVLDGCFVNELFWGWSKGFYELGYTSDDPVFSSLRGSMRLIQRDMILLENQIPLFILELLFCLQLDLPNHDGVLAKLALQFFSPLKPIDRSLHCVGSTKMESNPLPYEFQKGTDHCLVQFQPSLPHSGPEPALHCLELFRQSLLHPDPKRAANGKLPQIGQQFQPSLLHSSPEPAVHCLELFWQSLLHLDPKQTANEKLPQIGQQFIYCVTELRKKGIKFKKGEVGGFRNIQFKDGTLEIPRLVIQDTTRSLFLNLIAFEQCHINCGNDVTSYVVIMDNLINSAEDVGHLHDCGIMEHWLGSDAEVADLFNQLCKEVVFIDDGSYLSKLSRDVNTYSGNKWNGWMASLQLTYFNTPWSIISLIAAFILLGLTLAQTLYGVFGYYRPGS